MSVLEGPLVFADIETTGVSFQGHRIIEVAAIRVEHNRIIDSFQSLINPQMPLPPFITGLTGIRDDDLYGAPAFPDIATELHDMMEGAVFVAHNVRFDYGFLKRQFGDAGLSFNPKLLCTVKLSRALYPSKRGHKLQNLIDRCELEVTARHRAFDDAKVMWQFVQHIQGSFPAVQIDAAVRRQLKAPSLPRGLEPSLLTELPEAAGVYIFEDADGRPLYIGKSVNLKKRVMNHFSSDHSFEKEFKIAQQIANIETIPTAGELKALLLESRLIKERQPLYNRQLRRTQKLSLLRQVINPDGFVSVTMEDAVRIDPDDIKNILGVYTTKGKAREHLNQIIKDYGLCPKLMGLERGPGVCFSYQLKRCAGACAGIEDSASYNSRLLSAFESRRLAEWPFETPVLIEEPGDGPKGSVIVDQWCVVADLSQHDGCEPDIRFQEKMFDLDTYKILRSYLAAKVKHLNIKPITYSQLEALAA